MKFKKLTRAKIERIAFYFDCTLDLLSVLYLLYWDWKAGLAILILIYGTKFRMVKMFKERDTWYFNPNLPTLNKEELKDLN